MVFHMIKIEKDIQIIQHSFFNDERLYFQKNLLYKINVNSIHIEMFSLYNGCKTKHEENNNFSCILILFEECV